MIKIAVQAIDIQNSTYSISKRLSSKVNSILLMATYKWKNLKSNNQNLYSCASFKSHILFQLNLDIQILCSTALIPASTLLLECVKRTTCKTAEFKWKISSFVALNFMALLKISNRFFKAANEFLWIDVLHLKFMQVKCQKSKFFRELEI